MACARVHAQAVVLVQILRQHTVVGAVEGQHHQLSLQHLRLALDRHKGELALHVEGDVSRELVRVVEHVEGLHLGTVVVGAVQLGALVLREVDLLGGRVRVHALRVEEVVEEDAGVRAVERDLRQPRVEGLGVHVVGPEHLLGVRVDGDAHGLVLVVHERGGAPGAAVVAGVAHAALAALLHEEHGVGADEPRREQHLVDHLHEPVARGGGVVHEVHILLARARRQAQRRRVGDVLHVQVRALQRRDLLALRHLRTRHLDAGHVVLEHTRQLGGVLLEIRDLVALQLAEGRVGGREHGERARAIERAAQVGLRNKPGEHGEVRVALDGAQHGAAGAQASLARSRERKREDSHSQQAEAARAGALHGASGGAARRDDFNLRC
mmetsp:Transcript_183/g.693  ORF Transcript_183/g.693 Transcript_183/m.693 type:complete len:381 (-) Transcript_183:51-1193(-)